MVPLEPGAWAVHVRHMMSFKPPHHPAWYSTRPDILQQTHSTVTFSGDETRAKYMIIQECIPVGCVPADQWPYPGGGLPARGGSACQGGLCLPGGVGIPACTEADPPPVNRMTDRCKNITLAKTSFRPVKICLTSVARAKLNDKMAFPA